MNQSDVHNRQRVFTQRFAQRVVWRIAQRVKWGKGCKEGCAKVMQRLDNQPIKMQRGVLNQSECTKVCRGLHRGLCGGFRGCLQRGLHGEGCIKVCMEGCAEGGGDNKPSEVTIFNKLH